MTNDNRPRLSDLGHFRFDMANDLTRIQAETQVPASSPHVMIQKENGIVLYHPFDASEGTFTVVGERDRLRAKQPPVGTERIKRVTDGEPQ